MKIPGNEEEDQIYLIEEMKGKEYPVWHIYQIGLMGHVEFKQHVDAYIITLSNSLWPTELSFFSF